VITVTVLDENGKQDRRVKPFYEVSLGDADAVFELLEGLLPWSTSVQGWRWVAASSSRPARSAVRRVINQRFKSASLAWRVEQLEALLYLRALVKSGRWEQAVRAWLCGEHWLETVVEEAKRKDQAMKMAG